MVRDEFLKRSNMFQNWKIWKIWIRLRMKIPLSYRHLSIKDLLSIVHWLKNLTDNVWISQDILFTSMKKRFGCCIDRLNRYITRTNQEVGVMEDQPIEMDKMTDRNTTAIAIQVCNLTVIVFVMITINY